MSEKLSERMRESFQREHGMLVAARVDAWSAEVATLERQLAEALAEPSEEESTRAAEDAYSLGAVRDFIAARRKRIVGDK